MNTSWLRSKIVLLWGIAIAVGGTVITILTPSVINWMFISGSSSEGQGVQSFAEVILRAAAGVLPPLGAAFIGAAVVIAFLERSGLQSPGFTPAEGANSKTIGRNPSN